MICALRPLIVFAICLGLAACRSHPPLETVEKVDIERFMGNWYIIAKSKVIASTVTLSVLGLRLIRTDLMASKRNTHRMDS
jgi:hypothetical protein